MLDLLLGLIAASAVVAAGWGAVRRHRRDRAMQAALRRLADVCEVDGLPASGDAAVDALTAAVARTERARVLLTGSLDTIALGIVITDDAGALVFANEVASGFTGAQHGDALVEDAVRDVVRGALQGARPTRQVDLYRPPRRALVVSGFPVPAEPGPGGVVVLIEDVTERRRLEAARSDFVANISHELKTPVGALVLLAETILSEDDPAVVHRLSARMLAEADRAGRTIDDLLLLSRIESDERREWDSVPVVEVVADAVDRIRSAADQREVHLEVREPSRRLTVHGDRRQLVSALFNLLDNAVKYSDPGGLVEVSCGTDGLRTWVAVADHGIGIPRRDLDRIFERFYRVDRARSRQTGGTGLGLSIVRHIAENHGGEIRAESAAGEGSTFTLVLPAGVGPVAVAEAAG